MKLTATQKLLLGALILVNGLILIGAVGLLSAQSAEPPIVNVANSIAIEPTATSKVIAAAIEPVTPTALPITPYATPTIDPRSTPTPTPTVCNADWCQVLGVQAQAQPVTPDAPIGRLGYAMQIHGCGATLPSLAIRYIREAGFDWIKQQVRWDEIEGVKGVFAWQCVDEVVRLVNARGLKVLLSLNAAPKWARFADTNAPDPNLFAAFAAQVAQRYQGRVQAIEVYNEPNLAIEWGNRIDPNGYATLLSAAYRRIKAIDPHIMVISAGLAPTRWNDWGAALDDLKFLRQIAGRVAANSDCVGVHFNDGRSSPLAPGSPFEQIVNDYASITGKPLCLTEFGIAAPFPDTPPPPGFEWSANTTEADQARWLVEGFQWAQRHPGYVQLIVVWNFDYFGTTDDPNSLYSLQTSEGLRPAYIALKAMNKR
jgi:hypothetical protein